MRRQLYPRWVEQGRIDVDVAKHRIEVLQAILVLLEGPPKQGSLDI